MTMTMTRTIEWITLCCLLMSVACSTERSSEEQERPENREGPASEVAGRKSDALLQEWMTGAFSSAEQATADTSYYDIRLQVVSIWPERSPGFWLYVEQAVAGREDDPYRQRVYHLVEVVEDVFRSTIYTLPDPLRFAGQWRGDDPLRDLPPAVLAVRDGCDILLVRQGESFIGSTSGTGCRSELGGASYATSEVRISADLLYSWDRGFDEAGDQVWGATAGGYEFRKSAAD